jgi:hypothetical protein
VLAAYLAVVMQVLTRPGLGDAGRGGTRPELQHTRSQQTSKGGPRRPSATGLASQRFGYYREIISVCDVTVRRNGRVGPLDSGRGPTTQAHALQ